MVVRDSLEREINGLFEGSTLIFTLWGCGKPHNPSFRIICKQVVILPKQSLNILHNAFCDCTPSKTSIIQNNGVPKLIGVKNSGVLRSNN